MNFIENDQWNRIVFALDFAEERRILQEKKFMFRNIPAPLKAVLIIAGDQVGQRSFTGLAWAGKKQHGLVRYKLFPDGNIFRPWFHADNISVG